MSSEEINFNWICKHTWKKSAKREKKLAEKRAKKQAKSGYVKEKKEEDKTIPLDQVITLDHLTNPDKKCRRQKTVN